MFNLKKLLSGKPKTAINVNLDSLSPDAIAAAKQVFETIYEYKKVKEVETSRREAIRGTRDVLLEKLRSDREIRILVVDKVFSERDVVIRKHFEVLDRALESNDLKIVESVLGHVVNLVKSSPLEQLLALETKLESSDFQFKLPE